MTIAIYIRVSTDEQAQQGFSIDNQKERLEQYCLSQGWSNYLFYIDDGYTGTNTNRPALERLIKHIEEKKIKLVIVYKLDRLGRKQKDVLYLLEDVFDKHGVTFKSATEPFDTSTSLGKAMIGILAVFAQLERDTIIERTTAGRRQRVRQGMWYGGRVPFGYEWDTKKQELLVVPEQAELVKKAFKMYLQGQSWLSIGDWLATQTNERVFDHSVVRDMLQRPIYAGNMNNAGQIVKGNHQAIIDIETFEMVQNEIKQRNVGRAPIGTYLLSGLLECGECGSKVMHVVSKKNGYRYEYYACKNQHVRRKDRDTSKDCKLGYTRTHDIEKWVINIIKNISLNPSVFVKKNNNNDKEISSIKNKIKQIEKKLDRWYSAFEEGILNPSQLKERISKMEDEKNKLVERLDALSIKQVDPNKFAFSLKQVSELWDFLNFEEQKILLRSVVEKIVMKKDKEHDILFNL
jgi:site-specific DNA recombinase